MCVLLAINALPLNTDATAVQYTTYLIKIAEYVGKIVDDGSIYADRECFTDENIAGFLLKYCNEKGHKPHFKKAILAAIGSGLLHHGLPGIFFLCRCLSFNIKDEEGNLLNVIIL